MSTVALPHVHLSELIRLSEVARWSEVVWYVKSQVTASS